MVTLSKTQWTTKFGHQVVSHVPLKGHEKMYFNYSFSLLDGKEEFILF